MCRSWYFSDSYGYLEAVGIYIYIYIRGISWTFAGAGLWVSSPIMGIQSGMAESFEHWSIGAHIFDRLWKRYFWGGPCVGDLAILSCYPVIWDMLLEINIVIGCLWGYHWQFDNAGHCPIGSRPWTSIGCWVLTWAIQQKSWVPLPYHSFLWFPLVIEL